MVSKEPDSSYGHTHCWKFYYFCVSGIFTLKLLRSFIEDIGHLRPSMSFIYRVEWQEKTSEESSGSTIDR